MDTLKNCKCCNIDKVITSFKKVKFKFDISKTVDERKRMSVSDVCRECHRDKYLMKRYGMTPADYKILFLKQDGQCKICKESCGTDRYLHIDHCHKSGKVRGLLCHNCNTGLGMFKDNTDILVEAIKYLHFNTEEIIYE